MATGKFISYFRVSTQRQGRSGLGLDAQRKAVQDYLNGGNWTVTQEFTEIESGKRDDRPELLKALAACKKHRAALLLAKMDRLGRRASYVLGLLDNSGVTFHFVETPNASKLEIGVRAVVAEEEGRLISERTRQALAAAKARGRRLGWSIPSRADEQIIASRKGAAVNRNRADKFAANVLPIVEGIRRAGTTTLPGIAAALNERGIPTARGGQWYAMTVRNLLTRLSATQSAPAKSAFDLPRSAFDL